jgi:translation elongation factor EF-Tu-like GTPase
MREEDVEELKLKDFRVDVEEVVAISERILEGEDRVMGRVERGDIYTLD